MDTQPPQEPSAKMAFQLYAEYKKEFSLRNFSRIEGIIMAIMDVDKDCPLLHIIHGEVFLLRGNVEKSHFHLAQYAKAVCDPDPYAIYVIALWNDFMGHRAVANRQYAHCIGRIKDPAINTRILFGMISLKKRAGFYESSLIYFDRLLATKDGFKMYPCIYLQIIHTLILKKNLISAQKVMHALLSVFPSILVFRLRAYIAYLVGGPEEMPKFCMDLSADPYISYLIARSASEHFTPGVDVLRYFGEAIKGLRDSAIVYNSFGNHYFRQKRYSDAAKQYTTALTIDPAFAPALANMALIKRVGASEPGSAHPATGNHSSEVSILAEAAPDVEELGCFSVWSMLGYLPPDGDRNVANSLGPITVNDWHM